MGELEGKISQILNSPEEMEKILNIARSLTGSELSIPEPDNEDKSPTPITPQKVQEESKTDFSLDDLEINPDMLKSLGSVMGELTSNGGSSGSILDAIIPFLKPERQSQLKRAFSLAKMAKVTLGIFSDSGGGDKNV